MVNVCNSYWQYVGMYEMPLKIKEINLSLPSVALTFLLRSTVCQSHFLPLEICLSQRSEALLAEVGPWGGGVGADPGSAWLQQEGKKLHGRTLLHSTHSSTCLQDWTQHVVSLCVCVCVCVFKFTEHYQDCARVCKVAGCNAGTLFVAAPQHARASLITRPRRGFHVFLETVFARNIRLPHSESCPNVYASFNFFPFKMTNGT